MNRVAGLAIDHVRWVFAVCALLVVGGIAIAGGLTNALSMSLALPGQPGYEANQKIVEQYGGGGARALQSSLRMHVKSGASGPSYGPGTRVVAYRGRQDNVLVSADGRTTYVLVFDYSADGLTANLDRSAAEQFQRQAGLPAGSTVYTTGVDVLSAASGGGGDSSTLVETLLGAAGALIILAFVFGSFVAVVPLITAAVSILTTFTLVRGLTLITDVSAIVQYLIALIGLAVAIDYSLLIVNRWREERANGRDNRSAVVESIRTAGHSVVFSGVTVAVGLLALVVLPVPFLRSVGHGAVLIPLVSIAVSLTLLPALLVSAGPFLDRPRSKNAKPASTPSRGWTWWARTVIRFRWAAVLAGLAVLALLATPALSLHVGPPETSALTSSGPPTTGLRVLQSAGITSGALTPIEVLTTPGATDQVSERAALVPGVRGVLETGRTSTSVVLDVIPRVEASSEAGNTTLIDVRKALDALPASVGGVGANSQAFNDAVYGSFPLMLTIIVLLTLVLLARAFRSIVLAVKAVLLNLLSVGATYGFLTLIWQDGHSSHAIWGIPATGAITNFIPLMVFAFLFGLSMDYEVFILARMRESFDAHKSTSQAIVDGLGRTGKLVTSAALILFLSFLSLSQTPEVDIKVFATGLGGGILLDATIVRALLVPALVSLFGRWNWWMPARLARLLRIEASTTEYLDRPPSRQPGTTPASALRTPVGQAQ